MIPPRRRRLFILNMLRAVSDGVMLGAGTMNAEADYTCHVFDQDMEDMRIENGKNRCLEHHHLSGRHRHPLRPHPLQHPRGACDDLHLPQAWSWCGRT